MSPQTKEPEKPAKLAAFIGLPLPAATQAYRERQRRKDRCFRLFRGFLDLAVTCGLLGLALLQMAIFMRPLPKEWLQKGTISLQITDRHGRWLYEHPAENGLFGAWLPLEAIPPRLRLITLAAEDHRLEIHKGVDLEAILRAAWTNLLSGRRVSGASTLAMQLAKQWKPGQKGYKNKLLQAYWGMLLQRHLQPEGVLREYLNRAPYGNRVQGIQRASLLYFAKPAADLSLAEAAFLTALPWSPSRLNPFRPEGRRLAVARSRRILQRAFDLRWISKAALDEALRDPIRVQPKPLRSLSSIHLTEAIRLAWQAIPKGPADRQIARLQTTFDLRLQDHATQALQAHLQSIASHGAGTGALVVLDHKTGEILAYVASHNYFDRPQHGALDYVRIPRAPGSTLKPFLYGLAVEKAGWTGATLLSDLSKAFLWKKGAYLPANADLQSFGPLRMRVALGNSRNIPALQALSTIGVSTALESFRRLGFSSLRRSSEAYGLGLALGSAEVSLLELARAYGILARDGKTLHLRWQKEARDSLGRRIEKAPFPLTLFDPPYPTEAEEEPALQPQTAQLLSHILADPMARLPTFERYGHMEFPFPVSIKTGTSQAHRDAWMVGFSDRVTVACWVGTHDRRRMRNLYGAKGCGGVFASVMNYAMSIQKPHIPPSPPPPPDGWVKGLLCPMSGHPIGPDCPGQAEEFFLPGHPHLKTSCPFHKRLAIDSRNGLRAGPTCSKDVTTFQPFVFLPPAYAAWAQTLGLPRPPTLDSPNCPLSPEGSEASIVIRSPVHQARFLLDPSIPSEFSTLSLHAEVSKPLPSLLWFANGYEIARSSWPHSFRWPLKKGRITFLATSLDRSIRSRPVTVTIR